MDNNDIKNLQQKLDNSIDLMDIDSIDNLLNQIPDIQNIEVEPADIFADKIRAKSHKKERNNMKLFKSKFSKIAAIAAAVTVITCVGVGAANIIKNYTIADKDQYHNILSNQDLNENDIKDLTSDNDIDNDENSENKANVIKPDSYTFNSIEEAEKTLDMKVITPEIMPELELSDLSGQISDFGNGTKTSSLWANYGDAETKLFGITVTKTVLGEDTTIVSNSEMDEGSLGKYKSAKGYEFNTLAESNDDKTKTANIATITIGNYEYSLVFYNFEQDEINKILDSADLSFYE